MKRLVAFVTCLVMVLMCGAAMAAKPGDTVTVKVNLTADSDAVVATVGFAFNSDVLEFVSATATGATIAAPSANGKFGILNTNPKIVNGNVVDGTNYTIGTTLAAGELGTITFKVKDGAAANTYAITPIVAARNMSGETNLSVSIDSVVVEGAADGLLGDVNGDGYVDFNDAYDIFMYDLGFEDGVDVDLIEKLGDFNGDGYVDFNDAYDIFMYDLGF